jgi:hypothetical protein
MDVVMPNRTVPLRAQSMRVSIFGCAILGTFLAVGTIGCEPGRAAERHWLGEPFVGKVNEDNSVTAALQQEDNIIVVVQKDAQPCKPDYYLIAKTDEHPLPGRRVSMQACQMMFCTNPKLKKCGQPEKFTLPCSGTLDYQSAERIRLVVDFKKQDWDRIKCTQNADKDATDFIAILSKPPQPDPQDPFKDINSKLDCYVHNLIYPVKDHVMHKQCD